MPSLRQPSTSSPKGSSPSFIEGAAVVVLDLGGVVGDAPAGAEARSVGVDAAKQVQPELRVVVARVVLGQHQLHPAHGPVEPVARGSGGFASAANAGPTPPNVMPAAAVPAAAMNRRRLRNEESVGFMASLMVAPDCRPAADEQQQFRFPRGASSASEPAPR